MKTLQISRLVDNTSSNVAGFQLYSILEKSIHVDEIIEIDLIGSLAISSSFFNSSFGELIERHGFSVVTKKLKFKNVSVDQKRLLKSYFDTYKELTSC
jgi:nucleoside-triphosphatase THEP1